MRIVRVQRTFETRKDNWQFGLSFCSQGCRGDIRKLTPKQPMTIGMAGSARVNAGSVGVRCCDCG